MKKIANQEFPEELALLLSQVAEVNHLDLDSITRIWLQDMELSRIQGMLAILKHESGKFFAIINMPVLVNPVYGANLSFGDLFQLLSTVGDIPGSRYAFKDPALYFSLCVILPDFDESQVPDGFGYLFNGVKKVRSALLASARKLLSAEAEQEETEELPTLPDIKMAPRDMEVIFGVLYRCDQHTQEIYRFLMEKWARAGFFVETTANAIAFDVPYGPRRARVAMLMSGVNADIASLIPGAKPTPPAIVLPWQSLRRRTGFPAAQVDTYQEVVQKISPLHVTESSAHLEMSAVFDLAAARKLLKAMTELAQSVQPELVEPSGTSAAVTPNNIAQTLDLCDTRTRKVFEELISGWKYAGGTVQCAKVGRIYLKLKTKAHLTGRAARLPRNFNLLVLAAPKGKRPAHIQVTWDLAADGDFAYLDCIPQEVARFERTVFNLPGFQKKGTIISLVIEPGFKNEHTLALLNAIVDLKEAEESAQ